MLLRQYGKVGHYYVVKGYAEGWLVVNDGAREGLLMDAHTIAPEGDIVIIFGKQTIDNLNLRRDK